MKKLPDYSLIWKLLLVPAVAALSFGVYLIYPVVILAPESHVFRGVFGDFK